MSLSLDHALTLQRCRKGKVVDLGAGADDAIHARGSEAAHRAVATLTQAFASDPIVAYLAGGDDQRAAALSAAIFADVQVATDYTIYEMGDAACVAWVEHMGANVAQAAARRPPGAEAAAAAAEAALFRHCAPGMTNAMRQFTDGCTEIMEEFLKSVCDSGDCLNLWAIGVAPGAQGGGLGMQMFKHIARLADERTQWLYLESTCPRNRLLYLRLGFQDYRQLAMADDAGAEGPTLYCMYRPPGAAPFSRSTWWYMHDSVSHAQELGGSSGSLGGSRSSGSGNSSSDAARELAGDEEDPA